MGQHERDSSRLFARPIIDYLGPFSALPQDRQEHLRQLDAYGRAVLVEETLDGSASSSKDEQLRSRWLLGALSDLQTWELMLRLRGRSDAS